MALIIERNNFVKSKKRTEKIFEDSPKTKIVETRIVEIGLAVTEKEMMENAKGSYRENIWTAEKRQILLLIFIEQSNVILLCKK